MNQEIGFLCPATSLQNSIWLFQESKQNEWTAEENKLFETALALHDKDTPDRWLKVAQMIPTKTVGDVLKHYRELEEDVCGIEAGLFPVPGYASNSFTLDCHELTPLYSPRSRKGSAPRSSEQEKKKGMPWTEEEHRQFLLGLKKYGKGDWRNISRNFVTTRTPTQVASHAQKYFLRQLNGGKDKRRSSIHDITTFNIPDAKSPPRTKKERFSPHLDQNHNGKRHCYWKSATQDNTWKVFSPYSASYCGISSYEAKLSDQNMVRANAVGAQFGSYNYSTNQMSSNQ